MKIMKDKWKTSGGKRRKNVPTGTNTPPPGRKENTPKENKELPNTEFINNLSNIRLFDIRRNDNKPHKEYNRNPNKWSNRNHNKLKIRKYTNILLSRMIKMISITTKLHNWGLVTSLSNTIEVEWIWWNWTKKRNSDITKRHS